MAGEQNSITFSAEVKEVHSKKTASLDVGYKVVLYTDNKQVLKLGEQPGDTYFDVTVTPRSDA